MSSVGKHPKIAVLISGVAFETSLHQDGSEHIIDVIRPTGTLGDGRTASSGADRRFVSGEETTVVLLESSRLVHGGSRCPVRPKLVENLLDITARRTSRLQTHLELVSRRLLRERVVGYLAAERELSRSQRFTIPLRRAELASYLHVDRAALSRELSRMRDEGLIDYRRSDFVLTSNPRHSVDMFLQVDSPVGH